MSIKKETRRLRDTKNHEEISVIKLEKKQKFAEKKDFFVLLRALRVSAQGLFAAAKQTLPGNGNE